jgi:hypothetical protein
MQIIINKEEIQNNIVNRDARIVGASEIKEMINAPISFKLKKEAGKVFTNEAIEKGYIIEMQIKETLEKKFNCKLTSTQFIKDNFMASLDLYNKDESLNIEVKSLNHVRYTKAKEDEIWTYEQFGDQICMQALLSGAKNNYLCIVDSDNSAYRVIDIDVPNWYEYKEILAFYQIYKDIDTAKCVRTDSYWLELAKSYEAIQDEEKYLKTLKEELKTNITKAVDYGLNKGFGLTASTRKGFISKLRIPKMVEVYKSLSKEELEEYRSKETLVISYRKPKIKGKK